MANQKATEYARVVYEFGLLMQPLELLCRKLDPPSVSDYRIAIAQVLADANNWFSTLRQFATFPPNTIFKAEFEQIRIGLRGFLLGKLKQHIERRSGDLAALQGAICDEVDNVKQNILQMLAHIPVEWEPTVFEANTPFSAYLRIRECLTFAKQRLDYFDRYLKPQFFQLFLEDIDQSVTIQLVTTHQGIRTVSGVSELFRLQHAQYSLIEVNPGDLHDRNLRVDDQVFALGPGVDRAGIALTNFGPGDSTASGHAGLDSIIAAGKVFHQS